MDGGFDAAGAVEAGGLPAGLANATEQPYAGLFDPPSVDAVYLIEADYFPPQEVA